MAVPQRPESSPPRRDEPRGALASLHRRLVILLATGLACIGAGILGGLLYGASTSGTRGVVGAPAAARALPEAAPGAPVPRGARRRSFLYQLIPPPAEGRSGGPRTPRTVGDLARRLPLERQAAQVLLVGFSGTGAKSPLFARLRQRDLGGAVVEAENYVDPKQLIALTRRIAVAARRARHVAPLVMTSQEGGQFSEIPDLPPDRPPSRIGSPAEAARAARRSARALEAFGFNSVLAPVIDVAVEGAGAGPSGARLYSDEPDRVADYARATIEAYRRAGVLAAPKHFPGLGAATQPTEAGPAPVGLSIRELAQRDLRPFVAAVDAGAQAIVVGHGLYPGEDYVVPASLSRDISTGLLREQLGFSGLAITDDLASPAIATSTTAPDAAVQALKAGADMVWISGPRGDQESAYVAILDAVRKGELSRRRLDEAVTRVLVAKRELRLIR